MSRNVREKRLRQVQQERRRRRLLIAIPAVVIVLLVGFVVYQRFRPIEGVQAFGSQSREHDENVDRTAEGRPPVGGVHNPTWQNCGIYEEPVDPSHAVHSLEHGAVWLTYRPDLPAEQVAAVEAYGEGEDFMLVSPYPTQDSPVMATAWGFQLAVDDAADERIQEFINRYRGGGPEPGAACSGGVGSPRR